jgi:hypothetical protein
MWKTEARKAGARLAENDGIIEWMNQNFFRSGPAKKPPKHTQENPVYKFARNVLDVHKRMKHIFSEETSGKPVNKSEIKKVKDDLNKLEKEMPTLKSQLSDSAYSQVQMIIGQMLGSRHLM